MKLYNPRKWIECLSTTPPESSAPCTHPGTNNDAPWRIASYFCSFWAHIKWNQLKPNNLRNNQSRYTVYEKYWVFRQKIETRHHRYAIYGNIRYRESPKNEKLAPTTSTLQRSHVMLWYITSPSIMRYPGLSIDFVTAAVQWMFNLFTKSKKLGSPLLQNRETVEIK